MQKLEGDGLAFMHAGGTVYKRELKPGEKLRIDTGCLVAMTKDINYDVEFVGKVKTALWRRGFILRNIRRSWNSLDSVLNT